MVALADYGVFTRSVMLNDSTSSSIAENVISSLSNNSALLGWGESEQGLVSWASQNSVMVNAADWAVDLSVLSNLPLSNNYFPIQQDLIETNLSNCSRHTVCFVISDGDNIQWILNSLAVDTNWWASNQRGEVPITWTISPALIDLAPSVLNIFIQQHLIIIKLMVLIILLVLHQEQDITIQIYIMTLMDLQI